MDDPFTIIPLKQFAIKLPNLESRFNYLKHLISRLTNKHGLLPIFGGELEFYIVDSKEGYTENLSIEKLIKYLNTQVKIEKGHSQYEIDLPITSDIGYFIHATNSYKNKIDLYSKEHAKKVIFKPKPFINDYGSSLHIHLNFLSTNSNTQNLISDIEPSDNNYKLNPFNVEFFANILCNYMDKTKEYFLPESHSKLRLNHLYMAPTHISWGGNNRSCMIRIPDSLPKRIEHRLCDADIDLTLPIYAIISSIIYGIENPDSVKKFPRIYGNAFDEQYRLDKI